MNTAEASIEADDRGLILICSHCGQRNRAAYDRLGHTFKCGQCHLVLPPPNEPVEVPTEEVFDALIAHSAWPVVVDFWAPWCGPCKVVAPELVKVAAEGSGRWLVAKVNTEELPSLARRFQIAGIPTLALFKGGREIARQSGAMPASDIRRFMSQAGV